MAEAERQIRSVAIIGAGAAGAVTAAAFKAEKYFDKIRVFERRETAGGTWIYDPVPSLKLPLSPGSLPPDIDPPLSIPGTLPKTTSPIQQFRFEHTPIYETLTTNVPSVAMSFSDIPFPYGPFVPHYIPRQYIETYFARQNTDEFLSLSTTVEDVSKIPSSKPNSNGYEKWKLTLRKYDSLRNVDEWWEENFDAVVLANGHYSVPYVPKVAGLEEYLVNFPDRVIHSKTYRSPRIYASKRVLVIGNSASGHDIVTQLVATAQLPVYQSRRSKSRWEGDEPPTGISWEPIIKRFESSGRIVFEDDTYLDDIDTVIYCTGYLPSFPFWNEKANGRPLWDYQNNRIISGYQHTLFQDFHTLGIVGLPRVLTFRSFEYQAIALARLFSSRNATPLPPLHEQKRWEADRERERKKSGKKYHDVEWENGETKEWLGFLYQLAGLPRLLGDGRVPPVLSEEVRWAVEHVRKYPEPGKGKGKDNEKESEKELSFKNGQDGRDGQDWVMVERQENKKDIMAFI